MLTKKHSVLREALLGKWIKVSFQAFVRRNAFIFPGLTTSIISLFNRNSQRGQLFLCTLFSKGRTWWLQFLSPHHNVIYLPFVLPSPVPSSSSRFLGWIHDWNKIRMHLRQCGTKEASLAVIWTEERAAETERVNKACQACRTAWAEAPVSLGENIKRLLFPLLLSMGSCASPVNRQLSNHKSRTAFPTTWLVSLRSRCASGLLQHAWLREMHNTGVRPAQAGRLTWVRDWKHSVSVF